MRSVRDCGGARLRVPFASASTTRQLGTPLRQAPKTCSNPNRWSSPTMKTLYRSREELFLKFSEMRL